MASLYANKSEVLTVVIQEEDKLNEEQLNEIKEWVDRGGVVNLKQGTATYLYNGYGASRINFATTGGSTLSIYNDGTISKAESPNNTITVNKNTTVSIPMSNETGSVKMIAVGHQGSVDMICIVRKSGTTEQGVTCLGLNHEGKVQVSFNPTDNAFKVTNNASYNVYVRRILI